MVSDLILVAMSVIVLIVSIPVIIILVLSFKSLNESNKKFNKFLKEMIDAKNKDDNNSQAIRGGSDQENGDDSEQDGNNAPA